MTHSLTKFTLPLWVATACGCLGFILGSTGCDFGSADVTDDPSTTSTVGVGGFNLTSIQAVIPSDFIVGAGGVAFFNSHTLPIVGTCDRGVASVQITVNSVAQPTSYPCPDVGNLSFSLAFPADGQYTVVFTPIGPSGGATSSAPLTQGIYVKTTTPPAPIVTSVPASGNSFSPFVVSVGTGTGNPSGTIVVNGTTSLTVADYVTSIAEITFGQGTMTSSASAGTFSYTFHISQGQSIFLSFRATDIVGNVSTPTNILISTANVLGLYSFPSAGINTPKTSGLDKLTSITGAPFLGRSLSSSGNKLFLGVPSDDDEGP